MRKILLSGGLAALLAIVIVGCLKDEDFEDQQYGLQVPNVNSVSFPEKLQSPVTKGIVAQSTPQDITGPLISLNSDGANSSAVTVNLATDDALVAAANAADTTLKLELMPASSYTINSLNVTVPAGEITSEALKINIADANVLDPTKKYGIGFKITSVDQGYTVAKNLSTMVLAFTIKNQYEGTYNVSGYVYHPSAPRDIEGDATVKEVLTINGTTSAVDLGDLGGAGYRAWFQVDPATNAVTITAAPAAAGAPYTMFSTGLPNSNPGYTPQWSGSAECNNTYDPATKTFKVRYGYMGGTGWRVTEEILTLQ